MVRALGTVAARALPASHHGFMRKGSSNPFVKLVCGKQVSLRPRSLGTTHAHQTCACAVALHTTRLHVLTAASGGVSYVYANIIPVLTEVPHINEKRDDQPKVERGPHTVHVLERHSCTRTRNRSMGVHAHPLAVVQFRVPLAARDAQDGGKLGALLSTKTAQRASTPETWILSTGGCGSLR